MRYNFKEVEKEILEFWKKKKIYEKSITLNARGKKFYFLDGPPYTSGRIHIGTAWNKAIKDAFLRYKRMQGFNVWDRAGYDMHGLPIELKVEKKLGIKSKEEIPKFGVAKFIQECKSFAVENMKLMNEDFTKMGVWMDFDNAYQPIKNSYMEGEWWLVKKAHENNRLYKGKKVMHWCSHCATALAKHELEYKIIKDYSIFLKFKIKNAQKSKISGTSGTENEYLIIWTTTPWTIPFNLGIMVNPELDYVKAEVNGEIWIIAKGLVGPFMGLIDKKYKVIKEMKGTELEGTEYIHPLADEIDYSKLKEKHPKIHTVLLSKEYVDLSAGSGLVHMAPGCGPEDQEVGKRNNILPFNTLDEFGVFKEMGKFTNYIAKKDDNRFIEVFKDKLCLITTTKVDHDYAHCWRCKNPVIYRATDQWFFKIEDLREKMQKLNKKVLWVPKFGKKGFDEWVENLKDNGITRQRYWGTPVPIWQCDKCNNYEVFASIKELEKKADVPADIHKPYIDEVKYNCNCGGNMRRIPDILDVWIDAATASWNCLDYPREQHYFKLFPADFILEATEQVRLWFSMLMICSVIAMDKLPFLNVYMHGMVLDFKGLKMSKSLGNIVSPDEIFDKYSVDVFRFYTISNNAGIDLNYNDEDLKTKLRNLMVLWNISNYLIDLKANKITKAKLDIEEKYILSKLNFTIKKSTEYFDKYNIDSVTGLIEELFLELSRTYIQLTRDKSKPVVFSTIYEVLINVLKLLAPICPFITEKIYQNLKNEFKLDEQSIHHFRWPKFDEKKIDEKLERNMFIAKQVIQSILSAREKAQIGVRWPLKEAIIDIKDREAIDAVKQLKELIKVQTNVKDISFKDIKFKTEIKIDYNKIKEFGKDAPSVIAHLATQSNNAVIKHIEKEGDYSFRHDGNKFKILKKHLIVKKDIPFNLVDVAFKEGFIYLNKEMNEELEAEGYSRELMRRVQALRKKSGLEKKDKITLFIKVEGDVMTMLSKWNKKIAEKVGAEKIKISEISPARVYKNKESVSIRDTDFEIMFNKV